MRSPAPPPPVQQGAAIDNAVNVDRPSTQPSAPPPEEWPETSTTCPPGLHSLMHLDHIHVDRVTDGIEFLETYYSEKTYKVMNGAGTEQIYTAIEESSSCGRCCLGKYRGWDFHILDENSREVMKMTRDELCIPCCYPCSERVTVHSRTGELLGSVSQNWHALRPSFDILDSNGQPVLLLKGPMNLRHFFAGDVNFKIKSIDQKHNVGVMSKKWPGLIRNMVHLGHTFDITFPIDLDVKIKAVLIGACFLVDFRYFEEQHEIDSLSKMEKLQETQ